MVATFRWVGRPVKMKLLLLGIARDAKQLMGTPIVTWQDNLNISVFQPIFDKAFTWTWPTAVTFQIAIE
jgi:hypothetical protein